MLLIIANIDIVVMLLKNVLISVVKKKKIF